MKPGKTEQQNQRTRGLDQKTALEIVRILNREDGMVAAAVQRTLPQVARAVEAIVASLKIGGRLFYVGAGTSGRLAVLDASEIPPTYGTPPRMIQAFIAGGERALRHAVEGAEDSSSDGAGVLSRAHLRKKDVVVGIAASGGTPFVLGAIAYAKKCGCVTVGITSNRNSPLATAARIAIVPETGPEPISGSTRMKAGTAQKMVLNMLSTATMVRLGRVYDNWMMRVSLSNRKLRARGIRILQQVCGVDASTAEHASRLAGHNQPTAFVMLKTGASAADAKKRLAAAHGNLRQAIEMQGTLRKSGSKGKGH
ncbi:MAG TPA: N-acetylmuramic acid 6-phosphate etherase [Candidatus Acidoferrales bacterium]